MLGFNKYFLMWLFSINRHSKRLLQIAYDIFATMLAFFLALFLRLESLDYLYFPDTYIGVLITLNSTFLFLYFWGFTIILHVMSQLRLPLA